MGKNVNFLLLVILLNRCVAIVATRRTLDTAIAPASIPRPTSPPSLSGRLQAKHLRARQVSTDASICGYENGDPTRPRMARSGFECRMDTQLGLWGFCPTTVVPIAECGLVGNCVDKHACTTGCGLTGTSGVKSLTCTDEKKFCSTAILTYMLDVSFSYITCGLSPATDNLLAVPIKTTRTTQVTTSSSPTSITAAVTSCGTSSISCGSGCIPVEATCCEDQTFCNAGSFCIRGGCSGNSTSTLSSTTTTAGPLPSDLDDATPPGPSMRVAAIAGGIIGAIVILCIIVVIIYLIRRDRSSLSSRRREHTKISQSQTSSNLDHTEQEDQYPSPTNDKADGGWGPSELKGDMRPSSPIELCSKTKPVELPAESWL